MKERPILFSGPMVRAILDGRKTQTRRVLNPQPSIESQGLLGHPKLVGHFAPHVFGACLVSLAGTPYGVLGDRLWVRETWAGVRIGRHAPVFYRASCVNDECDFADPSDGSIQRVKIEKWRPAIFLPHGAHRITLEITEVRVQRLQEISEHDARAEGVDPYTPPHGHISPDQRVPGPGFDRVRLGDQPHRLPFADLWDRINGKRAAWASNPWVWAIAFRGLP